AGEVSGVLPRKTATPGRSPAPDSNRSRSDRSKRRARPAFRAPRSVGDSRSCCPASAIGRSARFAPSKGGTTLSKPSGWRSRRCRRRMWTAMISTDVYQPAEWHDFFLVAGGGAAALAGLVFVAMSINLDVVAQNLTHRLRAINMLTGFTAAFTICALALMGGQSHQAVGTEWLVVASVAALSYVTNYVQAARRGGSTGELRPYRLVGGPACYVTQIVGAVVLILGHVAGLYIAAVGLVILFAFMISGAWLLLVAVHDDRSRQ